MTLTKLFQTLIAVVLAYPIGEILSIFWYVGPAFKLMTWFFCIVFVINIWKEKF